MFMELLDIPDQKFLDVITLTPTPTLTPISNIQSCPRKKYFFDKENIPKISQNSVGKTRSPGTKNLNHYLRCTDKNFEDFIV